MSRTQIAFKAKLKLGGEIVPLSTELVFGDNASQDGTENGFLFKLDFENEDPPGVTVDLGAVIAFVEDQLGAGNLANNPGLTTLAQVFPGLGSPSDPFNPSNTSPVNIKAFSINSTTNSYLFEINVDIQGTDPSVGLITFPKEFSDWLKIDNLAISFSATSN